jgi:hypothetical protein
MVTNEELGLDPNDPDLARKRRAALDKLYSEGKNYIYYNVDSFLIFIKNLEWNVLYCYFFGIVEKTLYSFDCI